MTKNFGLKAGFTLIEVLVGLVIAGVLAGLAGGTYVHLRGQAHDKRMDSHALTLNKAIDTYLGTGGAIPINATPKDVVLALKAIPDDLLAKETIAIRALVAPDTGISSYADSDGRKRLVLVGGRFTTATSGSGWILDHSDNVQVTKESRRVVGAKFASTSKWLWDYSTSSAAQPSPSTTAVGVSIGTSAQHVSGNQYQISAPGSYTVTATTTASAGILSLSAGPYSDTINVSPGNQSVTRSLKVGPGAKFTIYATATVSAPGSNESKEISIDVNIPGTTSSVPLSLAITGPDTVTVHSSDGTKTVSYGYLLTYTDGTVVTGPITDASAGMFPYKAGSPGESRLVSDTQQGITATKTVTITYWPTVKVVVTSSNPADGVASITAPNASGTYDKGEIITISASPTIGRQFLSWSGDASGTNSTLSLTANNDLNIVANFGPAKYKLVAVGAAGGTVGVTTPNAGLSADGYPLFLADTSVTLSTSADVGKAFSSWTGPNGGDVTGGATGTLLMDSDKSVVGTFGPAAITHSLTVAVSNSSAGTPNGSASGLAAGASVPISLTLNPGWSITGVIVSGDGILSGNATDNARYVTIGSTDTIVTYQVAPISYSLTVTLSNPAAGTATASNATLTFGETATVSAALNPGWTIIEATVTGGATLAGNATDNVRTLTMGAANATVTYMVKAPSSTFALTLSSSNPAGGSVSGSGNYNGGDTASLTATPAPGWYFSGWTGADGGLVSGGVNGSSTPQNGTLLMTADRTVVANFTQALVTATWQAVASGGSGNYSITAIQIYKTTDIGNPVYAQNSPGSNIATVTVTLPPGDYVVVATTTDNADPSKTATVQAPLTVTGP